VNHLSFIGITWCTGSRSASIVQVDSTIHSEKCISRYEIEKFNGKNFSLWKLKMKAILRKDNYLVTIEEKPASITNQKWKEIDNNAIANLHLALIDVVLSSIAE